MICMEPRSAKGGKSEKDVDGKIRVQKDVAALNHHVL